MLYSTVARSPKEFVPLFHGAFRSRHSGAKVEALRRQGWVSNRTRTQPKRLKRLKRLTQRPRRGVGLLYCRIYFVESKSMPWRAHGRWNGGCRSDEYLNRLIADRLARITHEEKLTARRSSSRAR